MSDLSPGAAPEAIEAVAELHAAVRAWTAHIPQNLPYADLMFAFGFATLGDPGRAAALVAGAREVMEVPVPAVWASGGDFDAKAAAVTTSFLFKAFAYRIGEALAGRPHAGPLPPEVMAAYAEVERGAQSGGPHNSYLRAEYLIGRMRAQSRVLEPQERPDPYHFWSKNRDELSGAVAELYQTRDPGELAERVRTLLRVGLPADADRGVRLAVLHEAVPLSLRVGEAFAAELLELVPRVLAEGPPGREESPNLLRDGQLLERAVSVATHLGRGDLVRALAAAFCEFLRRKPPEARFHLANTAGGPCLRGLAETGQREEADRFLTTLRDDVLGGATAELRARYAAEPEEWGAALRALLTLAAGWLTFGPDGLADPVLDEARDQLLNPAAVGLPTKDYTDLARAYLTALGQGPAEPGLARVMELFREMPAGRITNTWTTAQYFSRSHLNLVEDAVFAATRMLSGPHPAVRA